MGSVPVEDLFFFTLPLLEFLHNCKDHVTSIQCTVCQFLFHTYCTKVMQLDQDYPFNELMAFLVHYSQSYQNATEPQSVLSFFTQVVQLHAELEQERSKNSALKSELGKVQCILMK